MELEFSGILTGPVLRGSWIVQLDADSFAGNYRIVLPGEEKLAFGGRSDSDVPGILLFYFQLSGLGRHVQFRQSFLHISYADLYSRTCCSAQFFFQVGGKNVTGHGSLGNSGCFAFVMEYRVYFSMG